MLYREIMAVCSEIHTKHMNTVCGQNVELLNVKLAVHIVTTGLLWVNVLVDTIPTSSFSDNFYTVKYSSCTSCLSTSLHSNTHSLTHSLTQYRRRSALSCCCNCTASPHSRRLTQDSLPISSACIQLSPRPWSTVGILFGDGESNNELRSVAGRATGNKGTGRRWPSSPFELPGKMLCASGRLGRAVTRTAVRTRNIRQTVRRMDHVTQTWWLMTVVMVMIVFACHTPLNSRQRFPFRTNSTRTYTCFCLSAHHQLGKVI